MHERADENAEQSKNPLWKKKRKGRPRTRPDAMKKKQKRQPPISFCFSLL